VYEEVKAHYPAAEIEKAETNAKHKMALVFRWYFNYSTRLALDGNEACRVDYQVHCGPALGSYNQWVMGTPLQNWRNRHVDAVAIQIMDGAAEYLNRRFREMTAFQI
jgi:trans-AT polyketide synthase/acyltransferase/oxidoreductase domain-containing protein